MKTRQKRILQQVMAAVIGLYGFCIGPSHWDASGPTFIMLALTVCVLVLARPAVIKSAGQRLKTQTIPVNPRSSVQG